MSSAFRPAEGQRCPGSKHGVRSLFALPVIRGINAFVLLRDRIGLAVRPRHSMGDR